MLPASTRSPQQYVARHAAAARARMRLARIARTDAVVAGAIRAWEQRLAPLTEAAPPITPSPRLWRMIALRLGIEPRAPGRRRAVVVAPRVLARACVGEP